MHLLFWIFFVKALFFFASWSQLYLSDVLCPILIGNFSSMSHIDYISSVYDIPVILMSEELMQQRNTVAVNSPCL